MWRPLAGAALPRCPALTTSPRWRCTDDSGGKTDDRDGRSRSRSSSLVYRRHIKLVVVGSVGVGKTSLLEQFVNNRYTCAHPFPHARLGVQRSMEACATVPDLCRLFERTWREALQWQLQVHDRRRLLDYGGSSGREVGDATGMATHRPMMRMVDLDVPPRCWGCAVLRCTVTANTHRVTDLGHSRSRALRDVGSRVLPRGGGMCACF